MIYPICTRADADNAVAYAAMAISTIPKSHRRKRVSAYTTAICEYFRVIYTGLCVENPFANIYNDRAEIISSRKVEYGTKKYSDRRETVEFSGKITITKITDKSVCYIDAFGGKAHMPLNNIIAIIHPA